MKQSEIRELHSTGHIIEREEDPSICLWMESLNTGSQLCTALSAPCQPYLPFSQQLPGVCLLQEAEGSVRQGVEGERRFYLGHLPGSP